MTNRGYVYLSLVGLTTNVNVVHWCKINNFKVIKLWFILLQQLSGGTQEVQCNLLLIILYV